MSFQPKLLVQGGAVRNILVTGGAGFIGSHFVHYTLGEWPDIRLVTLDALTYAGSLDNLDGLPDPSRHVFVEGDICDRQLVDDILQTHEIDTIVHFAAETHVDRSIAGSSAFIRTNIVGAHTLLEAARGYWLHEKSLTSEYCRFHHVSTDEVYGDLDPGDSPRTETSPYAPNSPYAASKAASDHLVRAWGRTYGLPYTITNCTNNYGPRQFPEKLIPLVIGNAVAGKEIPVYGDGRQVRDWLHVIDHCTALLDVLTHGKNGETYHIGGGNQPTNMDIVTMICDLLDRMLPESPFVPHRGLIVYVGDRPGHDRRYALDTAKIQTELGWHPTHTLENGLMETVRWYLDNRSWTDAVAARPEYREWLETNYQGRNRQ